MKSIRPALRLIISLSVIACMLLITSTVFAQQRQYTEAEIDEIVANAVPVPFPDISKATLTDESWELIYKYDPQTLPTSMELTKVVEEMTWSAIPGLPGEKSGTKGPTQITTTNKYPWSSIVHLYMRYGSYYAACSGAFVHNTQTVLTAGHCLYNHDSGGYPSEIVIIPGENGNNRPFGYKSAKNWATNSSWINYQNYRTDWGLILVDSFNDTGNIGTAYDDEYTWYASKEFETAGYPGDNGYSGDEMWWDKSNVDEIDSAMLRVNYHFGSYPYYCIPGQSGSSIFYYDGENYGATAVLTLASCHGVLVNDEIDETIRSFFCSDGCAIGDDCYTNGQTNPQNSCEVCNTAVSAIAWTASGDGATCDDGLFCTTDDVCSAGVCTGSAMDCDDGVFCNGEETCDEEAMECVSSGNPCDGECSESSNSCSGDDDDDDDDAGFCGC